MRLAGLGVLALALIGTLILIGQNGAFDSVWNRMTGETTARVEDAENAVLANFDIEGTSVFGAPVVQENPIILSGFPAYAGLDFRLPVDARPVSGSLNLDFGSLVAENAEGVLRVSINGQKRADFLLRTGERAESLQMNLTSSDLTSEVISVGLSLQGRGRNEKCALDDAIAAVVNISGSTGLRLQVASAPNTTQDRLALWGDRVPVSWVPGAGGDELSSTLRQAALLQNKGYNTSFVPNGSTLEDLRMIAYEAKRTSAVSIPAAYPIALTSDPSNEGARKFTRRASWRYSYNASDLPGGILPGVLDLRMKVGPTADELTRDVTVTVNNRLLLSRRVAGGTDQFNQSISIPADAQRQSNALDISVSAYDAKAKPCGDITESTVQLLPETVLRSGEASLTGPLQDLRNTLAKAGSVFLDGQGLTVGQASAASHLLASLEPEAWEVSANAKMARIRIATSIAAINEMPLPQDHTHWLVFTNNRGGKEVMALPIGEGGKNPLLPQAKGVALLVSIADAVSAAPSAQAIEALERRGQRDS